MVDILASVPVPVDPETIGGRIRAARKRLRISQHELAGIAKTRQTQLSDWERNIRKPERENILKVAHALGMSVEALTGHVPVRQTADIKRTHGEAQARFFQKRLDRLHDEVSKIAKRLLELAEQATADRLEADETADRETVRRKDR